MCTNTLTFNVGELTPLFCLLSLCKLVLHIYKVYPEVQISKNDEFVTKLNIFRTIINKKHFVGLNKIGHF